MTPGTVTTLLRGFLSADQAASKAHRVLHRKNQEKVNVELAKGRVKKSNAALEVVLHRTPEAIEYLHVREALQEAPHDKANFRWCGSYLGCLNFKPPAPHGL